MKSNNGKGLIGPLNQVKCLDVDMKERQHSDNIKNVHEVTHEENRTLLLSPVIFSDLLMSPRSYFHCLAEVYGGN